MADELTQKEKLALARLALDAGITDSRLLYEATDGTFIWGVGYLEELRNKRTFRKLIHDRDETAELYDHIAEFGTNVQTLDDQVWVQLDIICGIRREDIEPILIAEREGQPKTKES